MRKFTLFSDSSCDLPYDLLKELSVEIFPLHYYFGSAEYEDNKKEKDMTFKEFYDRMRSGEAPTTSAVSVGQIEERFLTEAKAGRPVLYVAFSSGLSTTYNAGVQAAKLVKEKYPEAEIYVVDSLAASLGQGLLVYLCAKKADLGLSADAVRDYAESIKLNICHYFTVDDLVYLKRGGRVSAATALVGGLLNIKPLLHVDNDGHLISIGKCRGRKTSIVALADSLKGNAFDYTSDVAFICHGDCIGDAELLKKILVEQYGFKKVVIGFTGPVIASHSGPGTLALFYVGGKR
ncbi:MAG: DegV family protein [Clostridia bacterium]|nr:DegV family protein [Clostridia bacterium]